MATTVPSRTKPSISAAPAIRPSSPGPTDADILWRFDMMDELGVFPHNASNCSVITLGRQALHLHLERSGLDAREHPVPTVSQSFIVLDKNTS